MKVRATGVTMWPWGVHMPQVTIRNEHLLNEIDEWCYDQWGDDRTTDATWITDAQGWLFKCESDALLLWLTWQAQYEQCS